MTCSILRVRAAQTETRKGLLAGRAVRQQARAGRLPQPLPSRAPRGLAHAAVPRREGFDGACPGPVRADHARQAVGMRMRLPTTGTERLFWQNERRRRRKTRRELLPPLLPFSRSVSGPPRPRLVLGLRLHRRPAAAVVQAAVQVRAVLRLRQHLGSRIWGWKRFPAPGKE